MNFTDEEIQEFKIEATDLLNEAENALLSVESGADFKKSYDKIFRSFHSLKGAAGMLELNVLQSHMHKIENLFQQFKEKTTIEASVITYFLRSIDAARSLLDFQTIEFNYDLPTPSQEGSESQVNKAPVENTQTFSKTPPKPKNLIFIIDDEEDLVEVLGTLMDKYALEWRGYTDPELAVRELDQWEPALILTDMKMPKMTGLDVLKSVKKITPDVPVLFLSGHLDKSTLIEAMNYGLNGVIEKPFKEAFIISQINMALQQYTMWLLLNKTIDMILFQFKDLEDFLKAKGKNDLAGILKSDVESLLIARRELKANKIR